LSLTEEAARALLCQLLPELRRDAAAGFWQDRLHSSLATLADGGSAVAVCQELGLITSDLPEPAGRGAFVTVPGLDPVRVMGDYICPGGRCPRTATRDERGRPPVCGLTGQPMRFQSR
jgi:hypothetical protein